MPFKFNPFTGNFDQTGSGGGGASYIDGEVAVYADLPLDGTAALNSAWLVREASGVWPVSRKQAGIYIRTATAGSSRDADYTYAGTMPDVFSDSQFLLYDNSDTSKNLAFNLGSISTGTTRTLTVPDGSGTIQLALVRSSSSMSSNVSLSAGRARHITYTLLGGSYQVTLPLTGNQSGDVCRFTNSVSSSSGAILTVARGNGSGGTVAITTLAVGQTATLFNIDGTQTGWTLDGVDTHTHAASEITSGVLDNARINFAAPDSIGSTTRNTGAFTTLNATNGTITASAPVLDLSQTWNNAAVAFTGLRFDVTNTTSSTSSRLVHLTVGGTSNAVGIYRDVSGVFSATPRFEIGSAGVAWNIRTRTSGGVGCNFDGAVCVGGSLQFNTVGSTSTSAGDVILNREAADTLALQRTTNPQTFRLYNTTDVGLTNFERLFLRWNANVAQIGTEAGGTGSARNLELQRGGTTRITLNATGTEVRGTSFPPLDCVRGDGTGSLTEVISSFAISASYSNYANGSGPAMAFRNGSTVLARLGPRQTAAGADFVIETGVGNTERLRIIDDRVTFGGTTNAFPALKRSSTTLQVRLADDSAFAPLVASDIGIGVTPERPLHIQGSAAFGRMDRQGANGPAWLMIRMATGTTVSSSWLFGPATGVASVANDDFSIIDYGTSTSGTSGTQRLTIAKSDGQLTVNGNLNLSTKNLVTDTATGTRIGTGTTQLLGFWNAAPSAQPAAVADATDAASTQARLNDLLARLRTIGIIAT